MKLKNKISIILRFTISFILVYWLIQRGELGYKNVEVGLSNIKLASLFLVITFCQLLIGSIRTQFLMQFHSSSSFNLRRILSITWASSFINCIAPSALFGEVFRIKELIGIDSNLNKDNTFYALSLSKVFSLLSLFIITVSVSLFVKNHPQKIEWLLHLLNIVVLFCAVLFIFRRHVMSLLKKILDRANQMSKSTLIRKRFDNLREYNLNFLVRGKNLLWIIALSLSIQILNTISFLLIIYTINPGINNSLLELTYAVPLGIIAMALPISISGLGVGHLAFSKLLSMFDIMNGADIFSIYFAYSYIFNFIGLVPFIILQKKVSVS